MIEIKNEKRFYNLINNLITNKTYIMTDTCK